MTTPAPSMITTGGGKVGANKLTARADPNASKLGPPVGPAIGSIGEPLSAVGPKG